MEKIKICFVNGVNPNFLGGVSLYQKNLIKYIKSRDSNIELTWVYKSNKNENYTKDKVNYVGLKVGKIPFVDDILFNHKLNGFLNKNYFDIINSHAIWGHWMKNYKKRENQILINTYHGVTYPYYKIHLKRYGIIKKILLSPLLLHSYIIEKPPIKNADKIICVSEKVKKQIEEVYGKRKGMYVVRTGVDTDDFKPRDKSAVRKEINLKKDQLYGLYVGKGGYWIKGLDRVVKISEEIYKKNKNYRLIVIGADYKKVGKIIENKEFLIFLENVPRDKMGIYYSASDIFFCLSRYDGGAPTLVTSEAMASGCLLVCSKDSEQEIIEDSKNGLIISKFDENDAKKIINTLNSKKDKENIIKNSIRTVKELSLEKWGRKYFYILK
jgi:glycosyltransferase involved in cell wall biosynthesis